VRGDPGLQPTRCRTLSGETPGCFVLCACPGWAERTGWSLPAKFVVILSGSLALALVAYGLRVRNLAPLRFVFALGPRRVDPVPAVYPVPRT
jgi:hypothetical protein